MKKLISLICVSSFMFASQVFAMDISDVVGSYKITHPEIPMMTFVSIEEDGLVDMLEMTEYGPMECVGTAVVKDYLVTTTVNCQNGMEFIQKINLEDVDISGETFTAPVYSSLYQMELMLNFERVEIPADDE